ncbi:MAG: histidine kinase [Bacteroidetes bacterium]|nr:histidine kinase [Bacteroidota bacterium]
MKISNSTIIQTAVWLGIWSVFVFSGDISNRDFRFFMLITVRVLELVLFFNVIYHLLLPLYFSDKKRVFFIFSILAFVGYIALSIIIDVNLSFIPPKEDGTPHEVPWRFYIMPPVLLGLMLFGAAATIRGFAAFEKKKKGEQEANRRRLEAELALLKSQINPHFLLNTLNNLYALSVTEPDKTPDGLLKLSEMVSYILYECANPRVALSADLAFIKNYIELQQLRLPPNITLKVELPENPPENIQIEPMILIPFIENAFKHGLTTKKEAEIEVIIELNHAQLILHVKNPLLPPKEKQKGQPSGIGMNNTRQRLQHVYGDRHQLHIEDVNEQHTVTLQLNLSE